VKTRPNPRVHLLHRRKISDAGGSPVSQMPFTMPSMKRRTFLTATAAAVGNAHPLLRAAARDSVGGFTIGGAVRDVTPPIGVSLSGSISRGGKSRGVNDPLCVRATVVESGGVRCAIAIVDACYLGETVFSTARRLVEQRTGIPATHLLVAATHSHAAPRALHIGRLSDLDDAWHDNLVKKIADAVAEADTRREPARLFAGAIALPELVKSRRHHAEPESVPPNPFGETGETVVSVQSGPAKRLRPAGAADPDFSLFYAARPDGSPLVLLGNFSIHYCGGYAGMKVSADYFGAFCRRLEKRLAGRTGGRRFTALHSNGTSGDAENIGTPAELADRNFAPFERGEAVGEWLAGCVDGYLPKLQPIQGRHLAVHWCPMSFGLRKPSPARLAWAADVLAGRIKGTHHQTKTYADETQKLAAYPDTLELPLQVLRIGGLTIAASPCETFAQTGLAIKAASTAAHTFTVGLANGYGGYLPTAEQHRLGGYETWAARSSLLAIEAEARLRQALVELVRV